MGPINLTCVYFTQNTGGPPSLFAVLVLTVLTIHGLQKT